NVVVVNADGTWGVQTNAFTYTAQPPQVNNVSPLNGPPGTIVTITGAEFGSRISGVDLRFNGTPANIISASRTTLTASVPFGATTGPVTVNIAGQTATGPVFTVNGPAASSNFALSSAQFIDATAGGTPLSFGNNDDATAVVSLPFTFTLFNKTYASGSPIGISTNGWISLDAFTVPDYQNASLPSASVPPALIAPFFADLSLPGTASVNTRVAGTAPNRQFVVEWVNAGILDSRG